MKKIISFAAAAALFFNCITVMPASYAAAQELPNLEDTENTAVPENLIPKSDDEQAWRPRWIRNTAGRNSANIQNIADINKWNQAHGAASDYVIYVDEGKTTAPAATLGYDGILMNTDFGFEAGKTYCVSLRAKLADKSLKKTNGTEVPYPSGENRASVGISITNETADSISYTKEYGKNGMTLGNDYADFKGTIKLADKYNNNGPHKFIIGFPTGYSAGSAIMLDTTEQDSVYVAPEQASRIANTIVSGTNKVVKGKSIELKSEVLNQLGITGCLDQSVSWYVTNKDKTKKESGFTVADNGETITISPGENVEDGAYAVVAHSAKYGLTKTQYIFVASSDYKDTLRPEMNENMIPKSFDEPYSRPRWFRSAIERNGDGRINYITDEGVWNDKLGASKSTAIYVCKGKTTNPSVYTGYDGIILKDKLSFESGKSYCVSLKAKLADKSLHTDTYPAGENTAAIGVAITNETYGSTSYTKEYGDGGMELDSEYKDYKGTILVNEKYNNNGKHIFVIGYPAGYTEGSAMSIDTLENDSVYIAPEQAYELQITGENDKHAVKTGDTLNLEAHMLNQIGIEGNLKQDFRWHVMDKARERFISDITVTPSENGKNAVVTVGDDVAPGIYDIVVSSAANDFVSGYEITVSRSDYIIYVDAKNGNDSNSGMKEEPLATLAGAKNKVRSIKNLYKDRNITVEFAEGTYRFAAGVVFDSQDSGTESEKIKYTAAPGAMVEFSGAVDIDISNAEKVTDEAILSRLYPEVRDKVVCVNIASQFPYELKNEEKHTVLTDHIYKNRENVELFDGDVRRPLAEWPNGDDNYVRYKEASSDNSFIYADSEIPSRWTKAKDFWVGGYLTWDYRYTRHFVTSVDPSEKKITLEMPESSAYYLGQQSILQKISQRWKAYNLLEEIDVPGEWYLDRDTMNLYYYKPENGSSKLEMSSLYHNMIELNNASYIGFNGITFTKSRTRAIVSIDSRDIDITNCTFTNLGSDAVYTTGTKLAETDKNYWQRQRADASYNFRIENNVISNIGGVAAQIDGGNVDSLTPSGNTFKNNIVYRCSMYKKYEDAIWSLGCGNEISHNDISCLPYQAIRLMGNDHKVMYNEIYNTCRESEDCGVIYAGRNTIARGHEIAYNYIHEGNSVNSIVSRAFNVGIYFDDRQCGEWAHHNIIRGVNVGMFGEGVDNTVEYNTIIDTGTFLKLQPKGIASNTNDDSQTFGGYIYDTGLYYKAYPNLETAINNPTARDTKKLTKAIGNYGVNSGNEGLASDGYFAAITKSGNVQVNSCEDFVDAEKGDYRMKTESSTAQSYPNLLNSSNFDINTIGLETKVNMGKQFKLTAPLGIVKKTGKVYFAWEDTFGATGYKLKVAKDAEFNNVVYETTVPYAWAEAEIADAGCKYYWRVTAVNSSYESAEEWTSDMGSFFYGIINLNDTVRTDSENKVTVNTVLSGDYEKEAYVYFAAYDESGKLLNITQQICKLGKDTFRLSQNFDASAQTVAVYVWDKNENPLVKEQKLSKQKQ